MADANFPNVSLLISADGADTSTTFTDKSWSNCAITTYGSAQVSTAQSVFGGASLSVNGSAGTRISTPVNTGLTFGSGDFTIEGWVYTTTTTGVQAICGLANGSASNSNYAFQMLTNGTGWQFQIIVGATAFGTSTGTVTANTWHHVALVRSGTSLIAFVDGVIIQTTAVSNNVINAPAGAVLEIGEVQSFYPWSGYIDEFRITKGVARYTSAFTVPTAAFEVTLYTGLSSLSLPPISAELAAGRNVEIGLPAITANAFGGAAVGLNLPALGATIKIGAGMGLVLPSLLQVSTAHDSRGEQAADITLPALRLDTTVGAKGDVSLPALTSKIDGTVTDWVSAALTLPALSATSAVTVSGMASAAISIPSFSSSSYSGALCSVTISGVVTQATGTVGGIGRAQVTLPLFVALIAGAQQNVGSANIVLPSINLRSGGVGAAVSLPALSLTAIGSAVVTATYKAYATNLKHNPRPGVDPHDEVTHYTNFPFTHIVRYQNSYYGANSTGLYLLEGTTDAGIPVSWDVKTATTDFKSPQNKTVASAYFGGRLGPADTITLHAGEGAKVQAYSYTTPRGALAQNYRQVFGKGIKQHRYYALEASGTGELALDDISLDVHNLSRRI